MFAWFYEPSSTTTASAATTPTAADATLGERAKSMPQELAQTPKVLDDDEFQLRLKGFDETDLHHMGESFFKFSSRCNLIKSLQTPSD